MNVSRWMASTLALAGLAGCSYGYQNPAEQLGPGEVGGRTVAGAELLLDGVEVSLKGSTAEGLSAFSRLNGHFAMLPLPVGRHTLQLRKGSERALQREVEIGWGKDGQPQGLWLGDVTVPATAEIQGSCAAAGVTLGGDGVAIDEVTGQSVPLTGGAGTFLFQGMPIGAHRIRVSVTDLGGTRYVGGPASVTLLASDAGAQKRLTPLALHPEGKGPADTALVTLRFAVAGLAPGLRLADLQVVGLPQSVPFQSDGAAQADVPEGRWTVSIGLPPGAGSLIPPPPVTFVAVAGQEIDLGTLYAVSDAAALIVRYACHTDADCAPAPGRCDPQSRTCLDWTPPSVGPTVAACVLDTAACLADTGLGTQNPSTQAYPLTCAATPAGNVDLACGGCCVDAGGALACAEPGYGGCAPAAVAAAVPVNGACRPDRWCWVNPQPAGNGLNALWGDRTGQLFAVGSGGTILHFDGARWTLEDSGTGSTLLAVWGSSASDVWAAGSWESGVGTVLLHRTGGRWTNANPAGGNIELRGLWGAGPADVWAVGSGGMIYHHDGAAWSQVTSPVASTTTVLSSVWGSSSTDVWAVGDGAVVLHWDGVAWNRADTVANGSLVTGTGPKDAWIAGNGLFHWDGTIWSSVPDPTGCALDALTAASPTSAWAFEDCDGTAATLHWNGSAWSRAQGGPSQTPFAAWARGPGEVWVAGQSGAMARWDGAGWSDLFTSVMPAYASLSAVAGSGPNDVWAVGYASIVHWDGTSLQWDPSGTPYTLSGVWAASPTDAWAVGLSGLILHWDGSTWSQQASPSGNWFSSVWGTSATDVWAVGYGQIAHWNGLAWSDVPNPLTATGAYYLYGLWGSGPNDVWATGAGVILHWDGAAWSSVTGVVSSSTNLLSVWGSAANDVWIVGDALLHWDGSTWAVGPVQGGLANASHLWGSGPNDVWMVGGSMQLAHWDGLSWTGQPVGLAGAIWGSSATDLWTVSGQSIIHRTP